MNSYYSILQLSPMTRDSMAVGWLECDFRSRICSVQDICLRISCLDQSTPGIEIITKPDASHQALEVSTGQPPIPPPPTQKKIDF
jgi:hypothetical protein